MKSNLRTNAGSSFHSPIIDFLGLGGLALVALAICILFVPTSIDQAATISSAAVVAHLINQPHFAVSYQIFYSNMKQSFNDPTYPTKLKVRYIFSGFLVPIVITVVFLYAYWTQNTQPMAYVIKAMFFLVGWHYSKQGLGCIIVDAVQKKSFFSANAKNILLVNAYACWLYGFTRANAWAFESSYWGVKYLAFEIPSEVINLAFIAMILTTTLTLVTVVNHYIRNKNNFPINGLVGYTTAIYFWVLASSAHPVLYVFVPALHSLQYLTIATKYKKGEHAEFPIMHSGSTLRAQIRRYSFWPLMAIIGYAMFWGIPTALVSMIHMDEGFPPGTNFIFLYAWMLVNIQHYFIDHVIWRKENPNLSDRLYA